MWTTKKIATALGLSAPKDDIIHCFKFDSRTVAPGNCFIALPGEMLDGNDFIYDARARGAACIIGQKDADFVVSNSYEALNKLGVYARDHSPAKRVAITGSVGKTTTTSFLAQILKQNHNVVAPKKSFNNHIGVPLTMTELSDNTEFGIFEVGTNHPGEIKALSNLVHPHIAIITKIGTAHIGNFGSKEGIAQEKAQILHALTDDGIGIVPDDEFLPIYEASGKKLIVMKNSEDLLPTLPKRLQGNITAIKKAAELLGIHDFDLSQVQVLQGRGLTYQHVIDGKKITIIDDAYNAAFDAFFASLEDLSHMRGRKILVVGDMGEVGEFAQSYHDQIAQKINVIKDVAHIIPTGPFISEALKIMQYPHDNAVQRIRDVMKEGDIIFFKGSNASGVSKILSQLLT